MIYRSRWFLHTLSQLLPKPIFRLLNKYSLVRRAFQKFSILKFYHSLILLLEFKSGAGFLHHLSLILIYFLAGGLVLEVEIRAPIQLSFLRRIVCRGLWCWNGTIPRSILATNKLLLLFILLITEIGRNVLRLLLTLLLDESSICFLVW